MANTLKTQIDNLVGSGIAATVYDDWVRAGARTIVDLLKQDDLERHSSGVTVPVTTGLAVQLYRIWKVLVNGYECLQYPTGWESRIANVNSLHKASTMTPVYIIKAGTLKTYDDSGNVAGSIIGIQYPTTIDTATDTDIVGVPENMHYAVILYAAIQARIKQMTELIGTTLAGYTISDIDLSGITPPSSPSYVDVSYINASSSSVSPTSVGSIPSAPTYTNVTVPSDVASAITAFDSAMSIEDIELSQSNLEKAKTMLSKYQEMIQESLGSFNKDMKKFEADVQKVIEQAQITLQEAIANAKSSTDVDVVNKAKQMEAIIQNDTILLNTYQADVQKYAQRVNALVSQYGTNLQIFQGKVQKVIAQHNSYAIGIQQLQSEYHEVINRYIGYVPGKGGEQ